MTLPRLSRWQRRFLAAMVVVAVLARWGDFEHGRWGWFIGLKRSDGSLLCGFCATRVLTGFCTYRRDNTVVFGAGLARYRGEWAVGANVLDRGGRPSWYWSTDWRPLPQ